MFYVYILYSEKSDLFYVGSTEDPWKRLEEHNSDPKNTFTSKHRPWELKAVFETGKTRGEAQKAEHFIKKQKNRNLIEKLVQPDFKPTGKVKKQNNHIPFRHKSTFRI